MRGGAGRRGRAQRSQRWRAYSTFFAAYLPANWLRR